MVVEARVDDSAQIESGKYVRSRPAENYQKGSSGTIDGHCREHGIVLADAVALR